jgi:hypothetical protein
MHMVNLPKEQLKRVQITKKEGSHQEALQLQAVVMIILMSVVLSFMYLVIC